MSKSEMFSPEEIAIIQTRQLRKTIHYVYDRSPFYRDLMDARGLAPAAIKSLDDLRLLPTTSRADLLREGERFLCVRPEETVDFMVAGTGAGAVTLKLTEADLARAGYSEHLSLRAAGLAERDVVLLGLMQDCCSGAGFIAGLGLRRVGAGVLRQGFGSPATWFRLLEQTRASAVIASPYDLLRVTAWAGREQAALPGSVRKLICVGESVRRGDFSLTALGQRLAAAWRLPLFSSYFNAVLSTTVCECEEGCGSHIHPELMALEVVDDQGQPVSHGSVGEICVTPFGVAGMPVLRYRTGDFARLHADPCACGRHTLRIGPVLSRRGQDVKTPGGAAPLSALQEILYADPDVTGHLVALEAGPGAAEAVRIWLSVGQASALERIGARLNAEWGLAAEFSAVSPETLLSLQTEDQSHPPRVFLDRRGSYGG